MQEWDVLRSIRRDKAAEVALVTLSLFSCVLPGSIIRQRKRERLKGKWNRKVNRKGTGREERERQKSAIKW